MGCGDGVQNPRHPGDIPSPRSPLPSQTPRKHRERFPSPLRLLPSPAQKPLSPRRDGRTEGLLAVRAAPATLTLLCRPPPCSPSSSCPFLRPAGCSCRVPAPRPRPHPCAGASDPPSAPHTRVASCLRTSPRGRPAGAANPTSGKVTQSAVDVKPTRTLPVRRLAPPCARRPDQKPGLRPPLSRPHWPRLIAPRALRAVAQENLAWGPAPPSLPRSSLPRPPAWTCSSRSRGSLAPIRFTVTSTWPPLILLAKELSGQAVF